jgi:fluoroquinolone resistance protein
LRKTSFKKSKLRECSFINTNLSDADFTDTDLQGTIFHQCKLDKADFRDAKNYAISLKTNTAKKAKFSYPEVMRLLTFFDIVIEGL